MLRLRFLGELEVWRDGERLSLPPSRKTRALLGYLAATGRMHRRERLCSMFWELPDDPRGSLRWSMSRLRAIVDAAGEPHILANRESVGFAAGNAEIDLLALRAAMARGLDAIATADLQSFSDSFRGEFLEGIELPGQHEFQTWMLAEREDLRQVHIRLLTTLAARLRDTPEPALVPLRQLVRIEPYGEAARLELLRGLLAAGREQEAERQFEIAERLFRELGGDSAEQLGLKWRNLRRHPHPAASPADLKPVLPAIRAGASHASAPAPLGGMPFFGRHAEQRRLAAAIETSSLLSETGVTLVLGEPGSGVSRLIAEAGACASRKGVRVLSGRARETGITTTSLLWADPLDHMADTGAAHRLAGGGEQLFTDVISAVAGSGDGTPLLLVLDDVHRGGDVAADLLHQFIHSTRHRPVSVFIGARPGELAGNAAMQAALRSLRHEGLVDEMHLGPLGEADAASLVAAIAPGTDIGRIVELSGGNPLFAIELARNPHEEAGRLPLSLWYLLCERLEALTEAGVELLRWAAVLGRSVCATQLREIAGLGTTEFLQALDLIEQHDILRPSDENTYRFTHDLLRRAILSTISSPRRTLMHLRIAEADDACERARAKAAMAGSSGSRAP